jgi:formylglycine-generating enzyme required for sulfatase activity
LFAVPGHTTPADLRPEPTPGDVKNNPKDGQRYVWIPAGQFNMGCSGGDSRCENDESPTHPVEITQGFWMGQTITTVDAWSRYRIAEKKEALPDKDFFGRQFNDAASDKTMPAVAMTWPEAKEFCEWAGGRLPTEAEWEYAGRAGNNTARYGYLDTIAWYADNSGKQGIESGKLWTNDPRGYQQKLFENGNTIHPVGRKAPNRWGLFDMLGNAWQWTADWYDSEYYETRTGKDPQGPDVGAKRVVRGGAWYSIPTLMRISARNSYVEESRNVFIGVRCVLK